MKYWLILCLVALLAAAIVWEPRVDPHGLPSVGAMEVKATILQHLTAPGRLVDIDKALQLKGQAVWNAVAGEIAHVGAKIVDVLK